MISKHAWKLPGTPELFFRLQNDDDCQSVEALVITLILKHMLVIPEGRSSGNHSDSQTPRLPQLRPPGMLENQRDSQIFAAPGIIVFEKHSHSKS